MRERLERGQALVSFAFMAIAMMGLLALGIDAGLLEGQRRFDQNGADAAALAASRVMAGAVLPNPNAAGVYFGVAESDLFALVTRLAGLNQNAALAARTQMAVSLEYSADGQSWCYSPSGVRPATGATTACTLPTIGGTVRPPLPSASTPFSLRVTVNTTTNGFFSQVVGANTGGSANCVHAPGPRGVATCATATSVIAGTQEVPPGYAAVPPTLCDDQITNANFGSIFELWGSAIDTCGDAINGWKDLLDFTPASASAGWSNGADFVADPSHTGSGSVADAIYWTARGFGGSVHEGDWLAVPFTGVKGGPISSGFFGGSQNSSGSYFFDKNMHPDLHDRCPAPDPYGQPPYSYGCRDAAVVTWTEPQWQSGGQWVDSGSGAPVRVRGARILVFRFYCEQDGTGHCSQPADLPGCNASGHNGICGRPITVTITSACPQCIVGPTLTGNHPRLAQ